MTPDTLSDEVALRIALATRVLPEVSIGDLIDVLHDNLGETLDEAALGQITVTQLKSSLGHTYDLDGEEAGEDARSQDIAAFKEAVKILWGEIDDAEHRLPSVDAYQDGDMPGSIRVAIASNNQERLDGHFGSCARFLIYQLSPSEIRLIDRRSTLEADMSGDKNAFRVDLIKDCHVLYVVAVGGPAAARIIRGGVYPMKQEEGGEARELLAGLQQVMCTSPPPWMAKALGIEAGDRVKNYKLADS